ncbi:MAG: ATP-binding protein, partial [Chloroflexia bacterium]|nr:ATP-binding protein [Chloroflexia bacterium]
ARLEGNTAHQAFHESATSKRSQGVILRDVVALANSAGGSIFLGVSPSEKRPIAGLDDATSLSAELMRDVAAQITPPVDVTCATLESDGKPILVLTVAEGTHKPHAIAPGGIFVRREAESAQATRDEIVHMVTGVSEIPTVAAPPAAPASPNGRGRRASAVTAPNAVPGSAPIPATSREKAKPAAPASGRRPAAPKANGNANVAAPLASPAAPPTDLLEVYEELVVADPVAPTTGIEVLDAFEQDGTWYYTLRDLRYHKLIHNVTKLTDRRLWRAAIAQREKGSLDESDVRWDGDYGIWRSYRQRSGDRRHDLVYRGDGDPRIFFGVNETGMDGRWRILLDATKATR